MSGWLVHVRRLVILAALVGVAPFLSPFQQGLMTEILIFGLVAASLDMLVGYTGLVSLGHILFFGVGGYTSALVAQNVTPNAVVGVLAAAALGALVALATGAVAVRTRGVYFLMLTLAFAQLGYTLAFTWQTVTGGSDGLVGIPTPELPGVNLFGRLPLYYWVLGASVLGYVVLHRVLHSPFGRTLMGIKENEGRMRALGYQVNGYKLASYTIAGAIGGYGGAMFVQMQRFVSPSNASFELSALLLIMVIVGGIGTLYGPVLGAGALVYMRDRLIAGYDHWELALGVLFILVVYFAPRGLGGIGRGLLARRRARPTDKPDSAVEAKS